MKNSILKEQCYARIQRSDQFNKINEKEMISQIVQILHLILRDRWPQLTGGHRCSKTNLVLVYIGLHSSRPLYRGGRQHRFDCKGITYSNQPLFRQSCHTYENYLACILKRSRIKQVCENMYMRSTFLWQIYLVTDQHQ